MSLYLAHLADTVTREEFAIVRCRTCGLGQTWPQPSDLAPYYSNYHGGRHGMTASFRATRRLRIVSRASRNRGEMRLLDVGCGEGTFLKKAALAGWKVAGTEMNPAVAIANGIPAQRSLHECEHLVPLDCVTFWHSLEHMKDPIGELRHARRMIATEGVLVIAVPNAGGSQARVFQRHWLHLDIPRHLFHFTEAALDKMLREAGFKVDRSFHQEFEYDVMGWAQSTLNALQKSPNLFFEKMMGRQQNCGALRAALNLAGGLALSAAAVPIVCAASLAHSGGTMIVVARPVAKNP